MHNFEGQTVIVTGGTRGIGRGISQAFLKAGACVVATYHSNQSKALEFQSENESFGQKLEVVKCDVTSSDHIESLFHSLKQKHKSLEILVNNCGIRMDAVLPLMEEVSFQKVIDTNLKGTFLMTKKAVLWFMENKYGRIINITSIGSRLALAGQANYAASKAAQEAFTKVVSKEVGKKGITINNIAPGLIDTELLDGMDESQIKEYTKKIPLKRLGSANDIAHATLFMAAKESSYITGATLDVSGGLA